MFLRYSASWHRVRTGLSRIGTWETLSLCVKINVTNLCCIPCREAILAELRGRFLFLGRSCCGVLFESGKREDDVVLRDTVIRSLCCR